MGNDKTYMWITIMTAVAFAIGITVAVLHIQEYTEPALDTAVGEDIWR